MWQAWRDFKFHANLMPKELSTAVHKICRASFALGTYSILRCATNAYLNQTNNDEARRRRACKSSAGRLGNFSPWLSRPREAVGDALKLKEIKGARNLQGLWETTYIFILGCAIGSVPLLRKFQLERSRYFRKIYFDLVRYCIRKSIQAQSCDARDILFKRKAAFRYGRKKKKHASKILSIVISDSPSAFGALPSRKMRVAHLTC